MTTDEEYIDKLISQIRKLACVSFGVPTEHIFIQITPSRVAGQWYVLVSREHALTMTTERGKAQNCDGRTLLTALRNMHDALVEAVYGQWQSRYEDRVREMENTRTNVLPEDDFVIDETDRR